MYIQQDVLINDSTTKLNIVSALVDEVQTDKYEDESFCIDLMFARAEAEFEHDNSSSELSKQDLIFNYCLNTLQSDTMQLALPLAEPVLVDLKDLFFAKQLISVETQVDNEVVTIDLPEYLRLKNLETNYTNLINEAQQLLNNYIYTNVALGKLDFRHASTIQIIAERLQKYLDLFAIFLNSEVASGAFIQSCKLAVVSSVATCTLQLFDLQSLLVRLGCDFFSDQNTLMLHMIMMTLIFYKSLTYLSNKLAAYGRVRSIYLMVRQQLKDQLNRTFTQSLDFSNRCMQFLGNR